MNKFFGVCLALVLMLVTILPAACAQENAEHPCVRITVRDYGDIYAELYPEYAPLTVENFLNLVGEGFYDGLTFHRIISGFMIQGGDPLGNGTGGSAQKIKGEFSQNGVENPLAHERGVLSMARSSDMNSASSQFFIMHADAPHLDGAYAAFGKVLCGMPVVDLICVMTPVQDSNGTVLSTDQPVIESIRVVESDEARAAVEAEQANGKAGTVYHDPYSHLSFAVPAGWNRVGYPEGSTALFRPEGDTERNLTVYSVDLWALYEDVLTGRGYSRDTLDTAAMMQLGVIRIDENQYVPESRSDVTFYTQAEGGSIVQFVGAKYGCLMQIVFDAERSDPLFSGVEDILDHLMFD